MFLQKCHELVTKIDGNESVFLGGFENDTFLLSQDESRVFASRAQLPFSHSAYFLAVSLY